MDQGAGDGHDEPDHGDRAHDGTVRGDGEDPEAADDGGRGTGIQQGQAPEGAVGADREPRHGGVHTRGDGQGRAGHLLPARVRQHGGGDHEQHGDHGGQADDQGTMGARGEERHGAREEQDHGCAECRPGTVLGGPRCERGLDEVGDGLDDVVVDLELDRVTGWLERQDEPVLDPLRRQAAVGLDGDPVVADQAEAAAGRGRVELSQLASQLREQLGDGYAARHAEVRPARAGGHRHADERCGRGRLRHESPPGVHECTSTTPRSNAA